MEPNTNGTINVDFEIVILGYVYRIFTVIIMGICPNFKEFFLP